MALVGFQIHITRKEFWSDEEGPAISEKEWTALAASDPSMRPKKNGDVAWVGYSKHVPGRKEARFRLASNGNVVLRFPDREIRAKMYRMAIRIGAKVQGDGGELYDEHGNVVASSRSFRRGLLGNLISVFGLVKHS